MRHMEDNRTVPFHSYNWSAFEKIVSEDHTKHNPEQECK